MSVERITEHLRQRARECPPSSSRLEVGADALAVLRDAAPPAAPRPWEPWGSDLGQITGLPIVEDAELEPLAWRLIDHEGQVMDSGTLTRPVLLIIDDPPADPDPTRRSQKVDERTRAWWQALAVEDHERQQR